MIRNATVDDTLKLSQLKEKVGRDTYFNYGTPGQFDTWVSSVCSEEYFEKLINNSTTVLVAEYEDAFLGMASVSFTEGGAHFGNLYVGLRERGIGSLLTQHRFSLVQHHFSLQEPDFVPVITSRCFYNNHRAYRHLLKHGFIPVDWTFNEQYDNVPMVIMAQSLTVEQ